MLIARLLKAVSVIILLSCFIASPASATSYGQLDDSYSFSVNSLGAYQNLGNGAFAAGQYLTGCDLKLGLVNSNTVFCRIRVYDFSGNIQTDSDYSPAAGINGTHIYHFDFHGNQIKLSSTSCYLLMIAPDSGFQTTTLYGSSTDAWTNDYTGCPSSASMNNNDRNSGFQNSAHNSSGMKDYYFAIYTDDANVVNSDITDSVTWHSDRTYKIDGNVTINSGVTVNIDPGTVVKFANASSSITVNGVLNVNGTDTAKVYFTSMNDDSVGTDLTASSTVGAIGDWDAITVGIGGIMNLFGGDIRYAGAGTAGAISNSGGTLRISSSTIASTLYGILSYGSLASTSIKTSHISTSTYGVYSTAGDLFVASSTIMGNDRGLYLNGGTNSVLDSYIFNNGIGVYSDGVTSMSLGLSDVASNTVGVFVTSGNPGANSISSSNIWQNNSGIVIDSGSARIYSNFIRDNSSYGVRSNDGSTSTAATYNQWGAADGPSGIGSGAGDAVSANVIYSPYSTTTMHYVTVDLGGNILSAADTNNKIYWDGTPAYPDEWYAATKLWNDTGLVEIATTTGTTSPSLHLQSSAASGTGYDALWNSNDQTLTLNTTEMAALDSSRRQHVIAHEIGHAIGLAHSPVGNIMYVYENPQMTLGAQDLLDLAFIH